MREACAHTASTPHAFCADLADEASCRALVPAVLQQFGRLDAVVNNASLFEYDDVARLQPCVDGPALAQQRRARRCCWRRRCMPI